MPIIERFLDPDPFNSLKVEYASVIDMVKKSDGELLMLFRPQYSINIYYQGNSVASITHKKSTGWNSFTTHQKFLTGISLPSSAKVNSKGYASINFSTGQGAANFICSNIKTIMNNIRYVGYKKEITEEQSIMQDNTGRLDFIIIDRQINDHSWDLGMDLLALKKVDNENNGNKSNDYGLCVIEVKLGNNPELDIRKPKNVLLQIDGYISHISDPVVFGDYKKSYEKAYDQYLNLGLLNSGKNSPPLPKSVNIVDDISGIIFVAKYLSKAYSDYNLGGLKSKIAGSPGIPYLRVQEADYRIV